MKQLSKQELIKVLQRLMNKNGKTFTPQDLERFNQVYAQKFDK
jgi:hypothetical protein